VIEFEENLKKEPHPQPFSKGEGLNVINSIRFAFKVLSFGEDLGEAIKINTIFAAT
jgi:hypothetical protein